MPRNGSGTMSLANSPFVAGTTIDPTAMNGNFSDIVAQMTNSVAADGQTPMTGDLNMNSHQLINATNITTTNITSGGTITASGGLYSGSITAGSGANGRAVLQTGDSSHTGYIAFFDASAVRQGYVGYSVASGMLQLESEGSATGYNVTGNLTVAGALTAGSAAITGAISAASGTIGGSAIVKADSGTYAISISGSASSAGVATTASFAPWSGISGIPANVSGINQSVASSGTPTFAGLSVGGVGISVSGTSAGSTSGWQLAPGGTSAFSGSMSLSVNVSGNDILAGRYIAASDGRKKKGKRRISVAEALRFVRSIPGYIYQKRSGSGVYRWEAGFLAQDVIAAGFPQVVFETDEPDMPARRHGSEGPAGKAYELQVAAAEPYLLAAVRHILDRLDKAGI